MPCFDPDSPQRSRRPRRFRRRPPATHHYSPLAGIPAWYREAFLAYDPKNPGEFIARVMTALAEQLHEEGSL